MPRSAGRRVAGGVEKRLKVRMRESRSRSRQLLRIFAGVAVVIVLGLGVLRSAAANGPTPLSQADEDVSDRVTYVERTLALERRSLPHDYVVSLAAMTYVVGHVSAPQYGYLKTAHKPLPQTPAEALAEQAGICGQAASTMLAILGHFHVPARRVAIYYSTPHARKNGHTTVEVRYDGAWHWFDPTWGTIYVQPKTAQWRVLSLVHVLRLSPSQQRVARLGDDTLLWNRAVTAAGRGFGLETGMLFLRLPHLRVAVGKKIVYRR
jgi:hypothetical protein